MPSESSDWYKKIIQCEGIQLAPGLKEVVFAECSKKIKEVVQQGSEAFLVLEANATSNGAEINQAVPLIMGERRQVTAAGGSVQPVLGSGPDQPVAPADIVVLDQFFDTCRPPPAMGLGTDIAAALHARA